MSTFVSANSTAVVTQETMQTTTATKNVVSGMSWDDATWILTSSFIIFTMQSGFGLLEAGSVSRKNEANIMVKNIVDVIFGGLSYWLFGFGFSFGESAGSNPFVGIGYFLVDADTDEIGVVFATFVFQLSFATTATTIVSGAMAERTKLFSYIIFSFLNTLVYCFPAHWVWGSNGFLNTMGCVDIAGSGVVHLVGGASALVATVILKPRIGRFDDVDEPEMGSPANAIIGMFMLWWGWLAFNCGSTFGISEGKWKLASKAAVNTLNGSVGGGFVGITSSYIFKNKKYDIGYLINGILGALVSITAACAVMKPWESLVCGAIGAVIVILAQELITKCKVDDPVSAVAVHGVGGIWGMLSVGIFCDVDPINDMTHGQRGIFHGGGFRLFGVQALACVAIAAWSGLLTFIFLIVLKVTIGIRMTPEEEHLGADIVEHGLGSRKNHTETTYGCSHVGNVSQLMISAERNDISYMNDAFITPINEEGDVAQNEADEKTPERQENISNGDIHLDMITEHPMPNGNIAVSEKL